MLLYQRVCQLPDLHPSSWEIPDILCAPRIDPWIDSKPTFVLIFWETSDPLKPLLDLWKTGYIISFLFFSTHLSTLFNPVNHFPSIFANIISHIIHLALVATDVCCLMSNPYWIWLRLPCTSIRPVKWMNLAIIICIAACGYTLMFSCSSQGGASN